MSGSSDETREITLEAFVTITITGPFDKQERILYPGSYPVGRGHENKIQILDPRVSRQHLVLQITSEGTVFARDLNSRNGTLLDGTELDYEMFKPLKEGSTLKMGISQIAINAIKRPPH